MLLIITHSDDISISQIIEDNLSLNFKVLYYDTFILNGLNEVKISNLENYILFEINNEKYFLSDFNLVWYKQFSFNQNPDSRIISIDTFFDFYKRELKHLHYYFHFKIFEQCRTINSPFKGVTNKLIQLDIFVNCGFKVPETRIITGDLELDFGENEYITKGISIPPQIKIENKLYIGYTTELDISEKEYFKNVKIFPTLIQKKINVKSELRVFYILKKIFAINIVVDRDNFVDYRSTNYSDDYKSFPVKLSKELEKRIYNLMTKLDLDSGSIDILIDQNDECIILEVNKYGQFGMINEISPNYMLKNVINIILDSI